MKLRAMGTALALTALVAGGCMSSGIVKVSADTYKLSRADGGGVYADAAAMRASVMDEANAFARGKGMIAVPVAVREDTMRVGHLSTIDYEFKLVAPGEAASQPVAPQPVTSLPAAATRPTDAVVEPRKPAAVDAPAAGTAAAKPDLYTELIKLDELRRRGILTDDEFRALKAKLIATM